MYSFYKIEIIIATTYIILCEYRWSLHFVNTNERIVCKYIILSCKVHHDISALETI